MQIRWNRAAAPALLVAAAIALWAFGPAALRGARSLDLLGMLREIDSTNAEIGSVNAGILTSLGDVRRQVEGVDRLRARLTAMEGLLQEQDALLGSLLAGTRQQAALSRELGELTAGAAAATGSMAQVAADEAALLERMQQTTVAMADQLRTIRSANQSTAGKLDEAERLSAVVLVRMP